MTNTCYSIVSRNERQRNIVWILFVFKVSNRIQKCRSRQLYSCGNQFNIVIISIQPPGRMKRSVVLSYKSLPSLCTSDTLATLRAGREGWRRCEHHMGCVMAHWVSRACGTPVLADPVLTHCLCPPAQPLPLLWCLEASGMALDELRLQALPPQGTEKSSPLQLSDKEGTCPGRLSCLLSAATASNVTPEMGCSWTVV